VKRTLSVVLLAAALLSLVGWTGNARGQARTATQNWEYLVVPADDDPGYPAERAARNQQLINQQAVQGWELTAVGASYFYFKRAK